MLQDHAAGRRLNFNSGFVGFDLGEHIAFVDVFATFFTQRTSMPSAMSKPSLGMEIVSAIISRPPLPPRRYQALAGARPVRACGYREAELLFAQRG